MNKRQRKKNRKKYNERLIQRYPFLLIRNRWTGKPTDKPYDYTELDSMPDGWRRAFGLEICEEIRNELIKYDCLEDYHIMQIKEKFGELRWYGNYYVGNVESIVNKYSELSAKTCINCGSQKTVKMRNNSGYICPYCNKCHEAVIKRIEKYISKIKK